MRKGSCIGWIRLSLIPTLLCGSAPTSSGNIFSNHRDSAPAALVFTEQAIVSSLVAGWRRRQNGSAEEPSLRIIREAHAQALVGTHYVGQLAMIAARALQTPKIAEELLGPVQVAEIVQWMTTVSLWNFETYAELVSRVAALPEGDQRAILYRMAELHLRNLNPEQRKRMEQRILHAYSPEHPEITTLAYDGKIWNFRLERLGQEPLTLQIRVSHQPLLYVHASENSLAQNNPLDTGYDLLLQEILLRPNFSEEASEAVLRHEIDEVTSRVAGQPVGAAHQAAQERQATGIDDLVQSAVARSLEPAEKMLGSDLWFANAPHMRDRLRALVEAALREEGLGPLDVNTKMREQIYATILAGWERSLSYALNELLFYRPPPVARVGVLHYDFHDIGGVQHIIKQWAMILGLYGMDVHVLSGSNEVASTSHMHVDEAIPDMGLLPSHADEHIIYSKLKTWIQDKPLIIIHNMLTLPANNWAFYNAARRVIEEEKDRRRFVAWTHDVEVGEGKTPAYIPGVTYIAISPATQRDLEKWVVPAGVHVRVIPNAIDFQRFLGLSSRVRDFFYKYELGQQDLVMCYTATFSERKNIEMAITLVAKLKTRLGRNGQGKVKLILVAIPKLGHQMEYYQKLAIQARELGVEKDVLFTHEELRNGRPWILTDEERTQIYGISDLLCFTSWSEGFGIPVTEAPLLGTPPLVLDIAPHGELLHQAGVLQLARNASLDKNADRIARYMRTHNMGVRARKAVFRNFDLELQSTRPDVWHALGFELRKPLAGAQSTSHVYVPPALQSVESQLEEAVEGQFAAFEIFFDSYRPTDIAQETRKWLKARAKRGGIKLQVRAPFGDISSVDGEKQLRDSIDFARDVNAPIVVLTSPAETNAQWIGALGRAIAYCRPTEHKRLIRLALENGPATSAKQINQLVERFAPDRDSLGICFSVGNANLIGSPADFLNQLTGRILTVHVSDNDGRTNSHLRLGGGQIDFPELMALTARKADLDAPWILDYWSPQRESDKRMLRMWGTHLIPLPHPQKEAALLPASSLEPDSSASDITYSLPEDDPVFHFTEGFFSNTLARDPKLKVAFHIQTHRLENASQVTIASPSGQTAVRFETSPMNWNVPEEEIRPFRTSDEFRGASFTLHGDRGEVSLNLMSVALHHLLMVRMRDWGGDPRPELFYETNFASLLGEVNQSGRWARRLEDKLGTSLNRVLEERGRVTARVDGHFLFFEKTTWDGKNHYRLKIHIPETYGIRTESSSQGLLTAVHIQSPPSHNVSLQVWASTDFEPLTPLALDDLLNEKGQALVASDPWFREAIVGVEFLAYTDRLLAGSWFFLSYFGRDSLIALTNLWSVLSQQGKAAGFRGVLNEISKEGVVNVTDEWSHEMALIKAMGEAIRLYATDREQAGQILIGVLKGEVPRVNYFDVYDNTFLLPPVISPWLLELEQAGELEPWLHEKHRVQDREESYLLTLLRNWNYALSAAEPYIAAWQKLLDEHPTLNHDAIIQRFPFEFKKLAAALIFSSGPMANWRDNTPLPVPEDINANLLPLALEAIKSMIGQLERMGVGKEMSSLCEEESLTTLGSYLHTPARFQTALDAWKRDRVREHYWVHFDTDELRRRLRGYLGGLQKKEVFIDDSRNTAELTMLLRHVIGRDVEGDITVGDFIAQGSHRIPESLKNGLTFTALSLDEYGAIPVMHSDDVYTLMLGNPSIQEIERIVTPIFSPFPLGLGLWDDIGYLISSATLANKEWGRFRNLWMMFNSDPDQYHGATAWGWPFAGLVTGLHRAVISRLTETGELRGDATIGQIQQLEKYLEACNAIAAKLGRLVTSELWGYQPTPEGEIKPVPLRRSTNPQLWSVSPVHRLIQEVKEALRRFRSANPLADEGKLLSMAA